MYVCMCEHVRALQYQTIPHIMGSGCHVDSFFTKIQVVRDTIYLQRMEKRTSSPFLGTLILQASLSLDNYMFYKLKLRNNKPEL